MSNPPASPGPAPLAGSASTIDPPPASGTLMLIAQLSKMAMKRTPESMLGMPLRRYITLSYIFQGPVSQQHLGDAMMMDANNVVLLLNELEADGLVRRERDPEDRRRHQVLITEAGRAAYLRAQTARQSVEEEVLGALSARERVTLHRLLSKALGD